MEKFLATIVQHKISSIIEFQNQIAINNLYVYQEKIDFDNSVEVIDNTDVNNKNNLPTTEEIENNSNFEQNEYSSFFNEESYSDSWENTDSDSISDEDSDYHLHQNKEPESDPDFNQEIIDIQKWAVNYNTCNYQMDALMKILRRRVLKKLPKRFKTLLKTGSAKSKIIKMKDNEKVVVNLYIWVLKKNYNLK